MSDIELPDFSVQSDLSIDIEKGIFLRKKNSNLTDNESNDSGNNSMNTNGSGTSCHTKHRNNSTPYNLSYFTNIYFLNDSLFNFTSWILEFVSLQFSWKRRTFRDAHRIRDSR